MLAGFVMFVRLFWVWVALHGVDEFHFVWLCVVICVMWVVVCCWLI